MPGPRAHEPQIRTWDAFLVEPAFETALEVELGPALEGVRSPRWPGLLTRPARVIKGDPVFARQIMPSATWVRGASLDALCAGILEALQHLWQGQIPRRFALHVYVPHPEPYRTIASGVPGLEAAFKEALRARHPEAARGIVVRDTEFLLQLALVGRTSILVSWAQHAGWACAPWPAGIPNIPEDRAAPSRAYKKLREALALMGESPRPGDRVVDLGASPGGWSHVVLSAGATVLAIDRAACMPPVAGHPRFQMSLGDALSYEPTTPVDWMICDVICDPGRTIALIERWAGKRLCRHLVATIKFKGRGDYAQVIGLAARIEAAGATRARVKHLHHNQNEVCVMASWR